MEQNRELYGGLSGTAAMFASMKIEEDWAKEHGTGGSVSLPRAWDRGDAGGYLQ